MEESYGKYKCIKCLYNINSLKNLKSISNYGILSKNTLKRYKVKYEDLSNHSVQNLREGKIVPNHYPLHDYANLYFDARNPMMYKLVCNENIDELCVLCIDKSVLFLPETVLTDRNAAASLAVFVPSINGLKYLDFNRIFAKSWNDDNQLIKDENKQIKCAEVLVLNKVPPKYILCIKVATNIAKQKVEELNLGFNVYIDKDLFFQK